ncbi:hypothetical protein C3B44_04480 [Corynebacterium yudongzhengii]|uniref:Uncharacterized protein n=2 Tax=Corynebacterium yudongzhengii TaxID=2080740 RepID=A0A2U1T5B6_9CORY|nr:hypothetical protein [Corynebacterium yudongzhengii]AWB81712.1 hypothetical protein C3B44_04480 [Corynebacterium yudongzhengii]PWC01145.1 hypothetical protein DF222_08730 [Corynebacterium yudongzhengii]
MLAELYEPVNDWLYPELTAAHQALGAAVGKTYGVGFSHLPGAEREVAIVNHLLELYAQATKQT